MIQDAMRSWRGVSTAGGLTLAAMAVPASAQQADGGRMSLGDIASAPLADLNLRRDSIPDALLRARLAPYGDDGLDDCAAIKQEIGNLDAVLGEDLDTAAPDSRGLSPGKTVRDVLTSLIPYRGVIRELSGASDHEYAFRQSIAAGLMRRAYLKGLGQAKDCPYPARPAHGGVFVTKAEEQTPEKTGEQKGEQTGGEAHIAPDPETEQDP